MISGLLSGLFYTMSDLDFRRYMPSPKKTWQRTLENGGDQLTADKTRQRGRDVSRPLCGECIDVCDQSMVSSAG